MTLSIPQVCSNCPSSNPAGPAPMIATFVRNTCSPDCYRLEHSRCGRSRICLQWKLYHITISAKGIEAQIVRREKTSMRKTFLALLLAASVTPAFAQEKTFELKLSH